MEEETKKTRPTCIKRIPAPDNARLPSATPDFLQLGRLTKSSRSLSQWLATLTPTIDEPQADLRTEGEMFAMKIVADAEPDSDDDGEAQPFAIRPEFQPIVPALMAALGAVVGLIKYSDISNVCGYTYSQLEAFSSLDKQGFRVLWNAAREERDRRRAMTYADEIAERVRNGTARPIVVRRARDHDEIEMVAVKNDTLLARAAELGIASRATDAAPQVSIGNQINFVTRLPDSLATKKAD